MPKMFVGGRGSGKTTECIKFAAEHNAYIVCRSQGEAHRIAVAATAMGLRIPFPITYSEFVQGRFFGPNINGFVIDDVDELVRQLARDVDVIAMSLYGDVTNRPRGAAWEPPETKP